MDEDLKHSLDESKKKKRIMECLDRLIRERNIRISECDTSQWHQLVLDAERLAKHEY
jgi:hypothetical protein